MANNNRFTITNEENWSVTADQITIGNVSRTWESLQTLQNEINSASPNSTLDITGRFFAASPGGLDTIRDYDKPLTITGGTLSGAMEQSWSAPVNGVVTADLTEDEVISGTAQIIDLDAAMMPRLAAWPEPPAAMLPYPTDSNDNWIVITEDGINNGTVQTVGGDNANGSKITGFTVTDQATLDYINSGINGLEPTSLCVFHHSSTNRVGAAQVVSWDPVTGVAVLNQDETLPYGSYFSLAFTGNAAFIRYDGDYVIDQHLNQAIYRPNGSNGQGTMVSLTTSQIWRSDYGATDLTFNGVEFFGGTGGCWSRAVGDAAISSIVFNDCYFHEAAIGVAGMADCYDCRFIRLLDRGIDGPDGITVERCYLSDIQHSSAISTKCTSTGDANNDPVAMTTIRDCFFSGPASDHGQAISLYRNTWQNCLIEHNLFVNMPRYIAFQPSGVARTTPGVCRFENNLMIFDSQLTGPTTGQPTVAFNGLDDTYSPNTVGQVVIWRSNTIMMSPEVYALGDDWGRFSVTIEKLKKSTVYCENNLVGSLDASAEAAGLVPHNRANNQLVLPPYNNNPTESVYGISFGSTDLPTLSEYGDYIEDWENLTLATPLTTAATDGGPVGIRWTGSPTVSQLLDPPLNWHTLFPAASVPVAAPGDRSTCWKFEDLRS